MTQIKKDAGVLSADRLRSVQSKCTTLQRCSLSGPWDGQQGSVTPCRRFGSKVVSSEQARELGLPSGSSQWLDADVNCFASCLSRHGKDFGLIAQQLQPPKSRGEVVCFYYDMWKTRRLPRARQWYNSMKAEVTTEWITSVLLSAQGHSCQGQCQHMSAVIYSVMSRCGLTAVCLPLSLHRGHMAAEC